MTRRDALGEIARVAATALMIIASWIALGAMLAGAVMIGGSLWGWWEYDPLSAVLAGGAFAGLTWLALSQYRPHRDRNDDDNRPRPQRFARFRR